MIEQPLEILVTDRSTLLGLYKSLPRGGQGEEGGYQGFLVRYKVIDYILDEREVVSRGAKKQQTLRAESLDLLLKLLLDCWLRVWDRLWKIIFGRRHGG